MDTSQNQFEQQFGQTTMEEGVFEQGRDLPSHEFADFDFLNDPDSSLATAAQTVASMSNAHQSPNIIDPMLRSNIDMSSHHHQTNITMSGFNNFHFQQQSDDQDGFQEQQQQQGLYSQHHQNLFQQQTTPQRQCSQQRSLTPQPQHQYGASNQFAHSASPAAEPELPYGMAYQHNMFATPNYNQGVQVQNFAQIQAGAQLGQLQTTTGWRPTSSNDHSNMANGGGMAEEETGPTAPNSKIGHPNRKIHLPPITPLPRQPSCDVPVSPMDNGNDAAPAAAAASLGPMSRKHVVPDRVKPGRKAKVRTEEEAKSTRRAQNCAAQAKSRDKRQEREAALKADLQEKKDELKMREGEIYNMQAKMARYEAQLAQAQREIAVLHQQLNKQQFSRADSGPMGGY